ncbi:ROK family protein [Nocardioides sp. GY 10113]|uniref:ROK family protein n=1 Tax=Nocardioides sp. GY 10113 TaxID=2569761 RepID=UPI0010A8E5F0|nr:ROK family protein [Nocardioides sp. GY 10113]TIC88676.1 ROK family protein [Nocardioides sp. GY 10113]
MYVGVDVGGTKVLAVAIQDRGPGIEVIGSVTVPMPGRAAPEAEIEHAMARAARAVATGTGTVRGVGISGAGLVDAAGERVRFAAHLPWRDAPVRSRLEGLLGVPATLDNDANCAAYAEIVGGAARGVDSAVLITVGTGIGGALVLGGRLHRGANGAAGEFGHVQVVPDGLACECGLRGCWEQYCSGRALERVMRVAVGRHYDGPQVTALARGGDEVAVRSIASVGTWLGVGAAGLVSAFDPEVVIVGGGVSAVGDLLLDPARAAMAESLQGAGYRVVPELVPAAFGPEAGAIGAALLARDGR